MENLVCYGVPMLQLVRAPADEFLPISGYPQRLPAACEILLFFLLGLEIHAPDSDPILITSTDQAHSVRRERQGPHLTQVPDKFAGAFTSGDVPDANGVVQTTARQMAAVWGKSYGADDRVVANELVVVHPPACRRLPEHDWEIAGATSGGNQLA